MLPCTASKNVLRRNLFLDASLGRFLYAYKDSNDMMPSSPPLVFQETLFTFLSVIFAEKSDTVFVSIQVLSELIRYLCHMMQ